MILFLLGFSICLNVFLVLLFIFFYRKFIPIFKSKSDFDLDFKEDDFLKTFNYDDNDFLESVKNLANVYKKG